MQILIGSVVLVVGIAIIAIIISDKIPENKLW